MSRRAGLKLGERRKLARRIRRRLSSYLYYLEAGSRDEAKAARLLQGAWADLDALIRIHAAVNNPPET